MNCKIIAFEGIDGSGKGTQSKLLADYLEHALNKNVLHLSFPMYHSLIGREIGNLLSGEQKYSMNDLDPKSICLWYALDRYNAFKSIGLEEYDYIIIDRYVLSSIAFQCARQNIDLAPWIYHLEHRILQLPIPDCYIVLDVDPTISKENVSKKSKETHHYMNEALDVNERDLNLLSRSREIYLSHATNSFAHIINCLDNTGTMLPQVEIHAQTIHILSRQHLI